MAPRVVCHRRTVLVVQIDRVHQFAVDVELELLASAVADAHRARAAVALQVVEGLLGHLVPAVDAIQGWHSSRKRTAPRIARTTRTIWCVFLPRLGCWTGMKSITSPTPSGLRKRVTSTLLSGRYICLRWAS